MQSPEMEPGTIAICSKGCVGIITHRHPKDFGSGPAWSGIHIDPDNPLNKPVGSPWSSRRPRIIGNDRDMAEQCRLWAGIAGVACQAVIQSGDTQ